MAGHSKWSKIKRAKGAADAKRSNEFTKLARYISIAVKEGGGITDPSMNFRLRLAVEKARAANMPKSNIERAIDTGAGNNGGDAIQTILYEGYAPGGVALIVESVTDNKQRSYSEIRNIFNKNDGTIGQPGSTSFMFTQVGQIDFEPGPQDLDELTLLIMEIEGVEDIEPDDELFTVYTDAKHLMSVRNAIHAVTPVKDAELVMKPNDPVTLDEAAADKLLEFVDKLEENDDVQRVFLNAIVE